MAMKKISRSLGLLAVTSVMVGTIGSSVAAQEIAEIVTGLNMVGGDVPTLDPQLAETTSSIDVINQIFLGLTAQENTDGTNEMGLASGYETTENEDGTFTYTFTLLDGVAWVRYNAETDAVEQLTDADGNALTVTAQDVVYGMTRALDPVTASPYSYVLLPYIVGATEFNSGTADASALAVEVVDNLTLSITAPNGAAFAPAIYGLWMARPVLASAIEEGGDSWTEAEYIATNGPFALKEWNHDESIVIVRNPFWVGTDSIPAATLDQVTFRFLDPAAQLAEFQAGTLQASTIPVEEIVRVQNDPVLSAQYVTGGNPCTYYIGFDTTEAPTNNVHLRRALSLAIDRESIVTNVTRGGQTAAQWFGYPGLNAALTPELNPDAGITHNPEEAAAEFAVALEELGTTADGLGLSLSYGDNAGHAAIAQAVQQMWTDTLGLTVTLNPMDSSTYFATISQDAPPAYRAGWCQDYGDVNNFLFDVFHSASSQNDTGFSSPEYDALVEEARLMTDVDARREIYVQAEEILVDEVAAVAPIYFYATNYLVSDTVERPVSITGNETYYDWSLAQ